MRNPVLFALALLFFAFFAAVPALAQEAPSQRELNGFLLGQYNFVLTHHLGKPDIVRKIEDDWEQRIYFLDGKRSAYMAFEFAPSAPSTIYAIQITGGRNTQMHPFCGLKLGDSRESVLKRLGAPSETKPLPDIGGEILFYDNRNYSIEVDTTGHLSSIKIVGYRGFDAEPKGEPDVARFAHVLATRDIEQALAFLMPDVEVFRDGGVIGRFALPARQELLDTKSPFYRTLLGADRGSVRYALMHETAPTEPNFRVRNDGTAYPVIKYPNGKYLREIVFRFHAGRWRVWEVVLK